VDGSPGTGGSASLALDSAGRPHISYFRCGLVDRPSSTCLQSILGYARLDDDGWHIEPVVDEGYSGSNTSLALDSADRPHISFSGDFTEHLKYAWHDGTSWHVETVDNSPHVGYFASLALDRSGHPHISYYDWANFDLKYAWHDGASWHIERADNEGSVGQYTSLALDGAGRPHISYSNHGLRHAWRDGTSWHTEIVDDDFGVGSSLALDGMGRPHISYMHYGDSELKHAWHDGTSWQFEAVDGPVELGTSSLVLDEEGRPYVAYVVRLGIDTGEEPPMLKYAWYDGSDWQIEMVDRTDQVGTHTSIALDQWDRPHISYLQVPGLALKYAWHDGATWHVETLGTVGQYWSSSLAVDRFGWPHISYGAKYTWTDGMVWYTEVVEDDAGALDDGSLALDSSGRPHISYSLFDAYGNSLALKHARHDGTAWHVETVESEPGVGLYSSLALDALDHPHISYQDSRSSDLKYARHDGTTWHIETVDSVGRTGYATSLALDEAARPHISYRQYDTYTRKHALKYAWHYEVTWHIQTVDAGPSMDGPTSLALDRTGRPYVSYHSGGSLMVAWHDGTAWITETVDSLGVVGNHASLALDREGWPHISYYDGTNHDLKYAQLAPPPLFLDKQASPSDGVHNGDLVTYTLTISARGLNVRVWDPLPPLVHYVPNTITSTVAPAAVYSPTAHAIAWHGWLSTSTVQTIRFQVTPGITGTGSLDLSLPIVNTVWVTSTERQRTVRSTAIVNGHHLYLPISMR
jgi:uncharacterized repeat protein (TIGR01451 family)